MKRLRSQAGFTLIELVMVILLLGILMTVAIPNFQDFRTEARNAATNAALGGIRSALAISRAAIALKEDETRPPYPTVLELQNNSYNASHPILSSASAVNKAILDQSGGIPVNPWSMQTIPLAQQFSIFDCNGFTKGTIRSSSGQTDFGWCYNDTTGQIWANTDRNGATVTENNF